MKRAVPLTPTEEKAYFNSTDNMQMRLEELPCGHLTKQLKRLHSGHRAFPEWDQSLPCVSSISPYKLRGVSDTCRGACCSQGPRQRAAGERDRTAGCYTWAKASGLKMRGTTRLSPQAPTGQIYFVTAHCSCLQIRKQNYSWLVLGWPDKGWII